MSFTGNSKHYSSPNYVRLLRSGRDYFQQLETLLSSAKVEIHLQTYVFEADETGLRIIEALRQAAQRGVLVYVLLDTFGSPGIPPRVAEDLRNNGVQLQFFGRFFSKGKFHLGRRLHRKVTVIDGATALVGGINISNHYNHIGKRLPWLDYALEVQGTTARRLRRICRERWKNNKYRKTLKSVRLPALPDSGNESEAIAVGITQNDFLRRKSDIAIAYRQAIRHSKKEILLVGAYFLPGLRARRLLKKAISRGVEIHCIFAAASDVMLSVYAREFLYQWMLRNGLHIHEYTPSNVHGKLMLCDGHWMSIGSFDLNSLSTYSNIELNLELKNEHFIADVRRELMDVINNECKPVTSENYRLRTSSLRKLKCWCSYQIAKTFFGLAYILAKGVPKRSA
jgi:cardiolipin synthase